VFDAVTVQPDLDRGAQPLNESVSALVGTEPPTQLPTLSQFPPPALAHMISAAWPIDATSMVKRTPTATRPHRFMARRTPSSRFSAERPFD
jgi:hypothetical protein